MAATTAVAWITSWPGLPKSSAVGDAVQRLLGENAGQQRADGAAHPVRRDDVERVVERRLRARAGRSSWDAAMAPSEIALIGPTKPAAGVMATSPTTMAVAAPTAVGLPARMSRGASRRRACAAGASIVVTNARPAIGARRQRAAGVEAEPAEPQQPGAEQRERHVVRQERRRP